MAYFRVNPDGTQSPIAYVWGQTCGIVIGYDVQFTRGGKAQTKRFPSLNDAMKFKKTLRLGEGGDVIPVCNPANPAASMRV